MPLQNRVMPTGEIVANPARGTIMGNRGHIHRDDCTLGGRRWTTHGWVTCQLSFRGRHRAVMGRGWTELFFLDEAVALAAGHRPCAECRRADYRRWQAAWQSAHGETPTAPAMNARLHADRVSPTGRTQRRHTARLGDLPFASFILWQDAPALVCDAVLHPFTPSGYAPALPADPAAEVTVLTPRCTIAVLRAGYRPALAPFALE